MPIFKSVMVAIEIFDASENGDLDFLKKSNSQLLNDSVCDAQGRNCLHYAARRGGVDLLKYLVIERKFTGNKRSNVGATPAHDAAAAGNLEALKWLLHHGGCNLEDQDGTGATILHLACRFQHTNITEWLLDSEHVDILLKTASGGLPLHFAVVGGDYDAVKLLLDEDPSSVNLQLSNGATPTYLAAQEGHLEILRLLMQDYRGNVRMKSYDGMSCVHAAAQCGHLDSVRFLVDEEKCNVNDRDFDGATPLHYAASQGHFIVIDWLMKIGKAAVTLDNLGGSPLHNAAENNHIECVKVLIGNGCSIEITDNNGLTASELARKCNHDNCANIIDTFQPNGQFLLDEDVAYLHSVQSPRVNSTLLTDQQNNSSLMSVHQSGIVQQLNHDQTHHNLITNGNYVNGYRDKNSGIQVRQESSHTKSPVRSRSPKRAQSPVEYGNNLNQQKQGDVSEYLRHNNWSTDVLLDTGNNSRSESSLSTFSNGEEVSVSREPKAEKSDHDAKLGLYVAKPLSLKEKPSVVQEQSEKRNVKFFDKVVNITDNTFRMRSDPVGNGKTVRIVNGKDEHIDNHGYDSNGLVKNAQNTMSVSPIVPIPSVNQSVLMNEDTVQSSSHDCSVSSEGTPLEPSGSLVSPIPPPPPPPPVPPLVLNGTTTPKYPDQNRNQSVSDDVKRKSASLPTRTQVSFTADIIQSKRSTLTPVQTKTTDEQKEVQTDFIVELKQATKGPALRKTNTNVKPLTPAMEFTSGSRKFVTKNAASDEDTKVELNGEWDPKNFYDQVPNKGALPAWKVMLQARQIAEKTRKQTLEQREVEEHESRFKNMPAWKRALLEKKEAEARATEERKLKQLQENQQQKSVGQAKKTPSVNVVGKSGDESNLAPWQLELQKR